MDRHGAVSETRDLGKDEPHPVALLPPSRHFTAHLLVDLRLRVDEAFEVERVRYLRLLQTAATSRGPASNSRCKPNISILRISPTSFVLRRREAASKDASSGRSLEHPSRRVASPRPQDEAMATAPRIG